MLKKSALFISSLLSLSLVYALESPFGSSGDIGEFIGTIGQVLHSLVTNQYSSFFILAIILFILLYNIFRAPLQKMSVFEGTPGKSIAVALTLLSELGIFYKARETGIDGLLSGIFGANNLFAGIVIAVLLFLIWRKALGSISNNKFALFLTGISCFALDSLLQTPMMSTIGFTLILISGIWVLLGHAKPSSAKTFTSRLKDEWKSTKGLQHKESKLEKKMRKDEEHEIQEGKKQHKLTKKEFKIYEQLVDTINKQISSKRPLTYYLEIIKIIREMDEFLEKGIISYNKELGEIADEQQNLTKLLKLIKRSISELKSSEKSKEFKKGVNLYSKQTGNFILTEEQIDKRIIQLETKLSKLNESQKNLVAKLGASDQEIHKRLRSIEAHQKQQNFNDSHAVAKSIKIILFNKEITLTEKEKLINKERKLSKKIQHLDKEIILISEELRKEVKQLNSTV